MWNKCVNGIKLRKMIKNKMSSQWYDNPQLGFFYVLPDSADQHGLSLWHREWRRGEDIVFLSSRHSRIAKLKIACCIIPTIFFIAKHSIHIKIFIETIYLFILNFPLHSCFVCNSVNNCKLFTQMIVDCAMMIHWTLNAAKWREITRSSG